MRAKRTKNRTIAICIALIIISLLMAILFAQVDSDTPMCEKGVYHEQREADN
jgi:hypothetical protein